MVFDRHHFATVAAWAFVASWVSVLAWQGGLGEQARSVAMLLVACGLIGAALGLPRSIRIPPIGWWWWLMLAVVGPPLIQAVPWGFTHPWVADDVIQLSASSWSWALDPDAAARSAVWAGGWMAALLLGLVLWRGKRAWKLAQVVVVLATVHALVALILAPVLPDWPTGSFLGRVRGTFASPNQAVDVWGACLPLALVWMRYAPERRRLWLFVVVILASAMVLSASRGGSLVGLLVAMPFAWGALPQHRRLLWASGMMMMAFVWLSALNLDLVTQRFSQLQGNEGATLNGRILVWHSAAPEALSIHNLWGAGPGAEPLAYLRGDTGEFGDTQVIRLFSDPLEWLVRYGWVGVIVLVAAVGFVVRSLYRVKVSLRGEVDPRCQGIAAGAVGGLLVLGLHSWAEYTWHSPALALLAVVFVVVLNSSLVAGVTKKRQSTMGWRIAMAMVGIAIAGATWMIEWPFAKQEYLALRARHDAAGRQQAQLPVGNAESVQQLLAIEPITTVVALNQAEIALVVNPDGRGLAIAEHALAFAATRSPGQPMGWMLRARIAHARGDAAAEDQAIARLQVWAPGWIQTRRSELAALLASEGLDPEYGRSPLPKPMTSDSDVIPLPGSRSAAITVPVHENGLAGTGQGTALAQTPKRSRFRLDPQRRADALRSALTGQVAIPPEVVDLAVPVLGHEVVVDLLVGSSPALYPAAEPWLRREAPLAAWLKIRASNLGVEYPPERMLVSAALGGPALCAIPKQNEDRQAVISALGMNRLPIPPALRSAAQDDGGMTVSLVNLWPEPGKIADDIWLARAADSVGAFERWLHHPVGRNGWDIARQAAGIQQGQSFLINRETWPPLLWLAAQYAQKPSAEHTLAAADAGRFRGLMRVVQQRGWEDLGGNSGKGMWWDGSTQAPEIRTPGWVGLAIDGQWVGWRRGTFSPESPGPGLHRLQVFFP